MFSKNYTWDIAISLCKDDSDFVKKLVKSLNPSLKVFFYEDRQDELISKSGPEVFAKTFKELSRVVVIISRKEWSESFYTEIERNAIIDRIKDDGFQFLVIIPMVQGETPPWYPSTQIYASPFKFSVEELAHFIEFKVTEKGGVIKAITLEDRYQNLLDRIEEKKAMVQLQESPSAIQQGRGEIALVKNFFNSKSDFLRGKIIDRVSWFQFGGNVERACLGIGDYLLECQIIYLGGEYHRIVTTQDFCVSFKLFKVSLNEETKILLEEEQRLFYYSKQLSGWSLPKLYENVTKNEMPVLFRTRDNSQRYDLTKPISTLSLVDEWFQKLLIKATESINRYI